MKVLILGADGMLGHRVFRECRKNFETYGTIRSNVLPEHKNLDEIFGPIHKRTKYIIPRIDATYIEDVLEIIFTIKPDYVINCIGIIKQRENQANNHSLMIAVNALLPHCINDHLEKIGGKLITFSSDCVFLGDINSDVNGPYTEKSIPNALSLYGRTKALGEVGDPALTLRTSFIGYELKGFISLLEWFIGAAKNQAKEIKEQNVAAFISGYVNAIWSGVTTAYLSRWLVRQIKGEMKSLSGLYQLTGGSINKFDLLKLIDKRLGFNSNIIPNYKIEKDKVCNRHMSGLAIEKATGETNPTWETLIDDVVEEYGFYK